MGDSGAWTHVKFSTGTCVVTAPAADGGLERLAFQDKGPEEPHTPTTLMQMGNQLG